MYDYYFKYEDEKTEKDYQAKARIKVTFERNWGADADGNRGTPRHFAETKDFKLYDLEMVEIPEKGNKALHQRAYEFYEKWKSEKAEDLAIDDYEGGNDDY